MINANELRIGNWVQNDAGVEWQFKDFGDLADNFNEENSTRVEPFGIPLSGDILLACGVEKADYPFEDCFLKKPFNVELTVDGYVFIMNGGFSVKVESLHQLQNLYFALTGKELEYSPNK